MSDTYDTVFQTQDLEGTLHWLGDQEARDRLNNVYTKSESDEAFRRIDDSYSSNDINDMFMSKADKADVYTIDETDTLLSDLEDRTRATFANIHATFVQFQNDVDVHFQSIEDDIDDLPNTYYNKTEVDAIAEELDRTKQNQLHPDASIIMTQRSDGSYDIGTAEGTSLIDDENIDVDKVWSSSKTHQEDLDLKDFTINFLPIGIMLPFGGSTLPNTYWLFCDGSSVLRDDYPDLFAVIGTTFGSEDATHFTLPDMRGRAVMGADTSATIGTYQTDTFASHNHSVTQGAHTHTITDNGHTHTGPLHTHTWSNTHNHGISDPGHKHSGYFGTSSGNRGGDYSSVPIGVTTTTGSATTGISVNNASISGTTSQSGNGNTGSSKTGITLGNATPNITCGSTGDTETRPKNVRTNWIIKAS